MSRRDDRDEVAAWIRTHPGATAADLKREFGLGDTTARRWVKQIPREGPPEIKLTKEERRERGAPADKIPEADRETALETVRTVAQILHLSVKRILREVQEGRKDAVDRDEASGLLNLQRTGAGILDQHPRLMELAHGDTGDDRLMSEEEIDAVVRAVNGN